MYPQLSTPKGRDVRWGHADQSAFKGWQDQAGRGRRLNRAFTFTLRSLSLVDRNDPLCDMVARRVIEIDAAGTHDPRQIATRAMSEFGVPK